MDRNELATRRFRLLVQQLSAEGLSQRRIARKLGISQGAVSFAVTGRNATSARTIGRAIERLRLRPEFFFDPGLGDRPSYRDHVGTPAGGDDDGPVAWVQLESEGYVDEVRAAGVDEAVIQHVRRTPEPPAGHTKEDLRDMLDAAVTRLRRARFRERQGRETGQEGTEDN